MAMAKVFQFYGADPMDMTWARMVALYTLMSSVAYEWKPKTDIEIMLQGKEDEMKRLGLKQLPVMAI